MTQLREDFASPAFEETIQRVTERMRERNIEVVVVDDGDHKYRRDFIASGGRPGAGILPLPLRMLHQGRRRWSLPWKPG